MPTASKSRIAKLTRPRLHDVVARARLFEHLDQCRRRPLTWVVGPPGAGKTALVGSYLEHRGLGGIWYHLDADDGDPATFFHYLSMAHAGSRRKSALPTLRPENLARIAVFTRHYFRTLFSQLMSPAVLVFDNYHDVPSESLLHTVLCAAVQEMPDSVTLVVISREDPPVEYAGLDALDRIARLEWPALRLTLNEARSIASMRFEADAATLQALYEASQGWAAGLTLALERVRRMEAPPQEFQSEAFESVFNYFAGQIFRTVEPEVREFLMRTALLRRLDADVARQLTGNVNAAGILEDFYRRRMFTDRRGGKPYSYQYHDLFRAFLLHQLERVYTPVGLNELRQRAGHVLAQADRHEEAFHLLRDACDWLAITELVSSQAQALLGQGRAGTLRDWITSLPSSVREQCAWTLHWFGMTLVESAPHAAPDPLEKAYCQFEAQSDERGQLASASALMLTQMIDMKSFQPVTPWVQRVRALLARQVPFPSPEVELQVNASLAYFTHQTLDTSHDPEPPLRRALQLLESDVPDNEKLLAGSLIIDVLRELGRLREAQTVVNSMRALLTSTRTSPDHKTHALIVIAWYYMSMGDRDNAWATLQQSEESLLQHGLTAPARHVMLYQGLAVMAWQRGDLAVADSHIRKLESFNLPMRQLDISWFHWLRGGVAGARDDWRAAAEHARNEIALMIDAGSRHWLYFAYLKLAVACVGLGEVGAGYEAIANARTLLQGTPEHRSLADVDFADAWVAIHARDEARFEVKTRAAVERLRQTELHGCLWYLDNRVMPGVLDAALQRGIETEYIIRMIEAHRLHPPALAAPQWPWPVKIHTLGRFELTCSQRPLERSRKESRKPLTLLKALICAGGAAVPASRLLDWIWPDSEADAAQKSLDMAVHRLRAMVGINGFIKVSDGQLELDRRLVWVDAWEFAAQATAASLSEAQAARVAGLYEGQFLAHDLDSAWAVSYRERLRDRFNRLICSQAAAAEGEGRFEDARDWYQRGLEVDDVVESFYQGIMRCQLRLGRRADVLSTFQRLRRTLGAKLRTLPSNDSAALAAAAEATGYVAHDSRPS